MMSGTHEVHIVFWLALAVVVGQGVLAATLLRVVLSFGTFTESNLAVHKSNLLVHQSFERACRN